MTTTTTTLKSTVTIVINFCLNILRFDLAAFGKKVSFDESMVHGAPNNDGISTFLDIVKKASLLSKQNGKKLLFVHAYGKEKERLKAMSDRNLADPDLGWSLVKEKGQKTLAYLYNTYGVKYIQVLRRVVCLEGVDHTRYYMLLCRNPDGRWVCVMDSLDQELAHDALILG
ncbi:MAG: hypothetical protein V4509_01425 [Patescibacteria group bacterium]